ncbi:MAG: hypothetical protein IKF19_03900, partial [Bacilli bacterium]|nr:hypothetical protein [Bacilli bacterium]
LTANWTRNFTCAAAGSNTDYMGRSWYTNSNDGTYCDLSLNDKVGASEGNSYDDATGTGNKSVYNYIKGFNANGLEAEYNAGLITQIDTNAGHNGSPSGVFWEGNATVYNSTGTAYYSYSQPSYKNITSGYNYYNYNTLNTGSTDIDFDDEGVGNSEKTFNLKGLASNTLSGTTVIGTNSSKTVSSGSSISYNTYTYSSVSTGNNSEYMTDFNDMTGLSGEDKRNVSFSSNSCGSYWGIPLLNYACSSDVTSACNKSSGRSYKWVFYSCGGGNATKSISLEIKNNTHFYYGNEATGKTGSNRPEWRYGYTRDYTFAGRTSATNSISGCDTKTKKNTRTYNFNNNTTYCKTYYTFTISNQTLPIMYRPHIKVKI